MSLVGAPRALSERVRVGESGIHGRGVFARTVLFEDDLIGIYAGPTVERDDTYVLWIEDRDGTWFGVDGMNELRFLNHSSRPNAEFEGDALYALRAISPGEELTIDYGEDWAGID